MKRIMFCFLCCLLFTASFAQGNLEKVLDAGIEFQAYPTGLMPGIRLEKGFKEKNAVHLRMGYNWVRHGDAGVKEDERGGGLGLTLGYKRYLKSDFRGWFFGVRNDVWFNKIDWKDNIGKPTETTGSADIIVVQPTVETGFLFKIGENLIFAPTIAFGYEINVKETGGDVGEGAIMLLGINFGKRF